MSIAVLEYITEKALANDSFEAMQAYIEHDLPEYERQQASDFLRSVFDNVSNHDINNSITNLAIYYCMEVDAQVKKMLKWVSGELSKVQKRQQSLGEFFVEWDRVYYRVEEISKLQGIGAFDRGVISSMILIVNDLMEV